MNRTFRRLVLLVSVSLTPAVAAAQAPPTLTPGPEHAVLKEAVGTWDASIEMMMPGAPATPPAKGVETNVLSCNGLCLVTDFTGQLMGAPFQGHGVSTWDPTKKKYTGSWSDSMAPGLALTESTWDAAKKTMNGTMLAPDGNGGSAKMRSAVEHTEGKRVFSMFTTGPDGKEMPTMRITYVRRN